jgi:tetratricopeptide (TPR) repeat protein
MKKSIVLLFFIPILALAQKQGQPLIDSLKIAIKNTKVETEKISLLNRISEIYINIDQDQGALHAKEAMALAEKINDKKGLAKSYQCLGKNTDSPVALDYYNIGLAIATEIDDKKLIGIIYRCIGVFYIYKNDYKNGLDYSFKSLKISEALNDHQEIAGNLLNIGFLYNDLKDVNQALIYFNKALEKNRKFDNPLMKAVISENIGVIYNNQNKNDTAIIFLKQALAIYEKSESLNFIATAKSTLGNCYMQLKQYDMAETYLKEALSISRDLEINRTLSNSLHILSMVYKAKYNDKNSGNSYKNNQILNQALTMLKEATALDAEVDNKAAQLENYREISEIYEAQNNVKLAFDAYKKFSEIKDSVYSIENKETVRNLEDQRTIELKEKELQLNTIQLENKEKQKWYLIGGIGLLAMIGGLLFYQSRHRRKINNKLQILNQNLDL